MMDSSQESSLKSTKCSFFYLRGLLDIEQGQSIASSQQISHVVHKTGRTLACFLARCFNRPEDIRINPVPLKLRTCINYA